MSDEERWRRCSACKKDIAFGSIYWTCNVSTCNRKRTGLIFCSVSCWEVHLPMANHREAWALEQWAPSSANAEASRAGPKPRAGQARTRTAAPAKPRNDSPGEILIVASRLKSYIRDRSGFNTSDRALQPLSDFVRRACDEAIRNADRHERKTVMGPDIPAR